MKQLNAEQQAREVTCFTSVDDWLPGALLPVRNVTDRTVGVVRAEGGRMVPTVFLAADLCRAIQCGTPLDARIAARALKSKAQLKFESFEDLVKAGWVSD